MTRDPRTSVKRTIIIVPASHAEILEVGQDCASLGQNDFAIEKIGEPFRDKSGRRMVMVTLLRKTQ